jgi:hypothetical protein
VGASSADRDDPEVKHADHHADLSHLPPPPTADHISGTDKLKMDRIES